MKIKDRLRIMKEVEVRNGARWNTISGKGGNHHDKS